LKAPVQEEDGQLIEREKGTPQGGVISPLLARISHSVRGDPRRR
jgi:RNA-directed DNA polymerase